MTAFTSRGAVKGIGQTMTDRAGRKRVIESCTLLVFALICLGCPESIQASTHEFYRGKTIRLVVGYAPGGGYDFYARTIARHIGVHGLLKTSPAMLAKLILAPQ